MISKYLSDIGLNESDLPWNCECLDPDRIEQLAEQRKIHGFDARDTYSLRNTIAMLIYPRLKMYDEVSGELIDKDFYKFEYKNKEYTFQECIYMVLEGLKLYLTKYDFDMTDEEMESVIDSMVILGKIWLYLWW